MGIESPIHLIFIGIVALLVLGPRRLPELARRLGDGVREFREAIDAGADGHEAAHEPPTTTATAAAPAPAATTATQAADAGAVQPDTATQSTAVAAAGRCDGGRSSPAAQPRRGSTAGLTGRLDTVARCV